MEEVFVRQERIKRNGYYIDETKLEDQRKETRRKEYRERSI